MSLVEQILWPDDVPFTGIPIPNFEAGVVSDITSVRIFNDRNDPATGSVLKDMHFSVANLDPDDPSIRLTSGIAPMDQLWPEVRFVDASSNIELHVTEWIRIGASSIITFPSMIADSWRQLEIRYRPPSYALTNPYAFFFFVHVGSVPNTSLPESKTFFLLSVTDEITPL